MYMRNRGMYFCVKKIGGGAKKAYRMTAYNVYYIAQYREGMPHHLYADNFDSCKPFVLLDCENKLVIALHQQGCLFLKDREHLTEQYIKAYIDIAKDILTFISNSSKIILKTNPQFKIHAFDNELTEFNKAFIDEIAKKYSVDESIEIIVREFSNKRIVHIDLMNCIVDAKKSDYELINSGDNFQVGNYNLQIPIFAMNKKIDAIDKHQTDKIYQKPHLSNCSQFTDPIECESNGCWYNEIDKKCSKTYLEAAKNTTPT